MYLEERTGTKALAHQRRGRETQRRQKKAGVVRKRSHRLADKDVDGQFCMLCKPTHRLGKDRHHRQFNRLVIRYCGVWLLAMQGVRNYDDVVDLLRQRDHQLDPFVVL